MTSIMKTLIVCYVFLFCAASFSQVADNEFMRIDGKKDQEIPQALLNPITVSLTDVTLEEALQDISGKAHLLLNYNRDRIPVHQKISVEMVEVPVLEVLLHILKKTDTDLIAGRDGSLAIVPDREKKTHKGTISGTVLDAETRTPLIGVNISLACTELGSASGDNGQFSIEHVPIGNYNMIFSYLGYEPLHKTDVIVKPNRITFVDADLMLSPITMAQVVVTGGYFAEVEEQPVSAILLSGEEIRRSSGTLGDVSRAMFGMPAIAKVNDSFNSLQVRGGSASENTFFIDNMEMPNISHFAIQGTSGGFLSLFNGDLLRDVRFYSGGFSSLYGDKLSSVMDISFREGNREELDVQADMSLAGVGGIAEGPLPAGKGSWLFAARKSFIEILFGLMGEDGNVPAYTDVQGKVVYDLSNRHRLTLLNIYGLSDLSSTREDALNDGENEYGGVTFRQNTFGVNWRYLWNKNGYSNTSISHTFWNFDWNWFLTRDLSESFDNHSLEQELKLRNVSTYRFNPWHKLEFGVDAKIIGADYSYYSAEHNDPLGKVAPEFSMDQTTTSQKYGAFASFSWRLAARLTMTPGLRLDHFAFNGNTHLSPRFSLSYELTDRTSLSGSVGVFYQNLPLILLYQQEQFKELRDPVANHYILSLSHLLTDDTRLTIEAYDKWYRDFPIDPTTPSLFIMDEPVYQVARFTTHQQLIGGGDAYSRGIELMVQKKLAKNFYGLVSGTYFKARYRDNAGHWRNRLCDNRFAFNAEGGFKPNEKWEFSLRWTFAGGRPYTPFDQEASRDLGQGVFDAERINAERLPAYNSLNLRFDRRFHFSRSNLIFYFSVWNALGSKNVWHYQWNEISNSQDRILQFERSPVFGLEFEF